MRAISLVLCLVLIAIWGPSSTFQQPAAAQDETQEDKGKTEDDQTQETEEEGESQGQGKKEEKGEVSKREEYSDSRVKCGRQKCVEKPKEANNQIWCEDTKDECDTDSGKPCKCELFIKSTRTDEIEAKWLLVVTEGIKMIKVVGKKYSCFCVRGK